MLSGLKMCNKIQLWKTEIFLKQVLEIKSNHPFQKYYNKMDTLRKNLDKNYPEHTITNVDTYDLLKDAEKDINHKTPMKIFIISPILHNKFDAEGNRFVIAIYNTEEKKYLFRAIKNCEISANNIPKIVCDDNKRKCGVCMSKKVHIILCVDCESGAICEDCCYRRFNSFVSQMKKYFNRDIYIYCPNCGGIIRRYYVDK